MSKATRKIFIVPTCNLETLAIIHMLKNAGYREGDDLFLTDCQCQAKWQDLEQNIKRSVAWVDQKATTVYGVELAKDFDNAYVALSHIAQDGQDSYKLLGTDCLSTLERVAGLIEHELTPVEELISVRAKAGDTAMRRYAFQKDIDSRVCDAVRNMELLVSRFLHKKFA